MVAVCQKVSYSPSDSRNHGNSTVSFSAMARNSDKNRVLARRRIELLNAVKHGANAEALAKRVTALKNAVFAVAKKHHVRHRPFLKFADNSEWFIVQCCWESFTTDKVILVVSSWGERASYKDILLACGDDDKTFTGTENGG